MKIKAMYKYPAIFSDLIIKSEKIPVIATVIMPLDSHAISQFLCISVGVSQLFSCLFTLTHPLIMLCDVGTESFQIIVPRVLWFYY